MTKFNPLNHPILLSYPLRLTSIDGVAYAPLAMVLIDLLRPGVFVELGTTRGVLYCSFCQAVRELNLDCRCYGISLCDEGERDGSSGREVFAELKEHHDVLYGRFSRLTQNTSDAALQDFGERSIDLLHLENANSYKSVQDILESWLPKMSDRGVVILGNTNLHDRGFDVWKLWMELKAHHPHLEFAHQGGLGVLSVGTYVPDGLRPLVEATAREASLIREFFSQSGERLRTRLESKPLSDGLHSRVKDLCLQLQEKKDELAEKESTIKSLIDELGIAENETKKSLWEANESSARLNYLSEKESRLNDILNSRAWRWVSRYGRIKNRFITPAYRLIKPVPEDVSAPSSTDEYRKWVDKYDTLTDLDRQAIRARIENLEYQPLISVVMPVYDVDEEWLRAAIESVRRQIYPNWELCIADDASPKPHVRTVLEEYTAMDPRIKVVFRRQNGHISVASNSALELTTGEFTALLDHDDEIPEHALYMVVEELNAHPETDLIYSDEDKIGEGGERCGPHFKPEFSPDLLYSYNMISHLGVYRTSIVKKIGGFREGYEGSQDYDLALRVIEQIPANHIRHIPHVLYHWRAIRGSVAMDPYQKEYAHEAARNAIRSHLKRTEVPAFVTQGHSFFHRVTYPVPTPAPLVSFIMGTRDRVDLLRSAVGGLLEQTYYQPVELILVNNQSHDPATLAFLREIEKDERVKVINYDAPFNFAAINNLGVKQSKGEIVCLINNDIKVISPDWLREMVSHALRPEIGVVGAKLYYPNNKVQHAGIILGVSGIAEHAHKRFSRETVGYVSRTHVSQNFSAVTGACMVLRRQVFDEVNGLDEVNLPIAFNDIDFCLRVQERGYRILWTPYAELYHLESASRGFGDIQRISRRFRDEISYMNMKWGHVIANDPYYSPNLTVKGGDFSLAFPPRAPKPWLRSDSRS